MAPKLRDYRVSKILLELFFNPWYLKASSYRVTSSIEHLRCARTVRFEEGNEMKRAGLSLESKLQH
jgi:hypothetical protein